jgi:hypothetical protein
MAEWEITTAGEAQNIPYHIVHASSVSGSYRPESGSSNLIVFETWRLPADPTRDLIVVQGLLRTLLFLNKEVTC